MGVGAVDEEWAVECELVMREEDKDGGREGGKEEGREEREG